MSGCPTSGHVLTEGCRDPVPAPVLGFTVSGPPGPDTRLSARGIGRLRPILAEHVREVPFAPANGTRADQPFNVSGVPRPQVGEPGKRVESRGEQKRGCPRFCDYFRVGTCGVPLGLGLSRGPGVGPRVVHGDDRGPLGPWEELGHRAGWGPATAGVQTACGPDDTGRILYGQADPRMGSVWPYADTSGGLAGRPLRWYGTFRPPGRKVHTSRAKRGAGTPRVPVFVLLHENLQGPALTAWSASFWGSRRPKTTQMWPDEVHPDTG